MKGNNITLTLPLLFVLVIGGIGVSQAFASTEAVFFVDVVDYDENKRYEVCMSSTGFEPVPDECAQFRGSEFENYNYEISFMNPAIGEPFYVSVQDLETGLFVYEDFENTDENPQTIEVSVEQSQMGPKQVRGEQFDVEGEGANGNQTGTNQTQEQTFDQEGVGLNPPSFEECLSRGLHFDAINNECISLPDTRNQTTTDTANQTEGEIPTDMGMLSEEDYQIMNTTLGYMMNLAALSNGCINAANTPELADFAEAECILIYAGFNEAMQELFSTHSPTIQEYIERSDLANMTSVETTAVI